MDAIPSGFLYHAFTTGGYGGHVRVVAVSDLTFGRLTKRVERVTTCMEGCNATVERRSGSKGRCLADTRIYRVLRVDDHALRHVESTGIVNFAFMNGTYHFEQSSVRGCLGREKAAWGVRGCKCA